MEWDFQDILGLNALDWVARKRDWRQFFRFRDRIGLIAGSAYHSALLLDPELARQTRKMPKAKAPQLFRFDNTMHRLTDIGDIVLKTAIARGGGDPDAVSLPRPITAADQLLLARRQAGMDKTIATFFPAHRRLTPRLT